VELRLPAATISTTVAVAFIRKRKEFGGEEEVDRRQRNEKLSSEVMSVVATSLLSPVELPARRRQQRHGGRRIRFARSSWGGVFFFP